MRQVSRFVGLLALVFSCQITPTLATVPSPEYITVRNGLPQGTVNAIVQDRQGFIWMATRDGLCRYDGTRFQIFTHDPQQTSSISFSSISSIKEDQVGQLWIQTETNSIDRFDPVTTQATRVSNSVAFRKALDRAAIVSIQPDQQGNVWVATQTNGFFRLHPNGQISQHFWPGQGDVAQRVLHKLLLDKQGDLWLAANDGLFRYEPKSGKFTGYRIAQGLPQNNVLTLHERANGELLLGFPTQVAVFDPSLGRVRRNIPLPVSSRSPIVFTRDSQGVDYVNQYKYTDEEGLSLLPADPKLARFSILSLLVDRSNVRWIGLNGDGIVKYDMTKRPFASWAYETNFQTTWLTQQFGVPISSIPVAIRQQNPFLTRYQFDRQNTLWIGGPDTHPYRYNASRKTFEPVKPAGIEARWLANSTFRLTMLASDPQGDIWGLVGSENQAVARYNPDRQAFTTFPLPLPANNPYVVQAMVADGGRIYLATKNHGLLQAELSTKRLSNWSATDAGARSLPSNALLCLAQDPVKYNHLWIGTFGGGLCRLDKLTGQITRFGVKEGLPGNVIYGIRPDRKGNLWLSTNRGLCRFMTQTSASCTYTVDDGLPSDEFNQFHDIALPDGKLIFGGLDGYTSFHPERIQEDTFAPNVVLTGLHINNQLVRATNPDSPIREDINAVTNISLAHWQNFLAFDFAALQFNQPGKIQYRYRLIGLDKDWVYGSNYPTATYTNLSPNTYTFVVNASNTSGIWSPVTHKLAIDLHPPFWATWWAFAGYTLLLIGAIYLYLRIRLNRIRLRSQIELREQEALQLKNLNEVKNRFFANITHEFRTPLTLILAPLEEVMNQIGDETHRNRLRLVHRNANRLLRLINELLDLAKLDAGTLAVTNTVGNLPEFVDRIVQSFQETARRQAIDLWVQNQLTHEQYWFDASKLDKILTNLVSNALKFTEAGGSIAVTLSKIASNSSQEPSGPVDERILLRIQDTGVGISEKELVQIFNRFYQGKPASANHPGGSGIGLALVKELVDVLHGSIRVDSVPGTGTTFFIELPYRPAQSTDTTSLPLPDAVQPPVPKSGSEASFSILLVEDNNDIAEYVQSILKTDWSVNRVTNGREGMEAALSTAPDLVISDVLMPEMNGYELCTALKANPATSHIPVILLTARTAEESRLEGFQAGADDYIEKPFRAEELRSRVLNRLNQQQRAQQYYRSQLLREGHLPIVGTSPEDEFVNRMYAILENKLDDSSFGVESLASELGISRMHLNRKVKTMTGITPNELIRVVRLHRAADLLMTGAPIAEVADRVGFDTPAYFSKVFKDYYRMTPSEFIEQRRREMA
ncbi:hybrid sensor histidine kinase/response regulator transcription factor [Spirosoma sp. KUDC1026]|uniref:hybrid sensor histidine kinase/response regulator transcription factor n=1 Tax=Spirosoma sp. KUDC1026 TaxID=2745947 RepID=UPI001E3C034C|nr:hybrid sensor histidine kinase/response regulator transcription factor [Spirosoma sp. KUDC1026]